MTPDAVAFPADVYLDARSSDWSVYEAGGLVRYDGVTRAVFVDVAACEVIARVVPRLVAARGRTG